MSIISSGIEEIDSCTCPGPAGRARRLSFSFRALGSVTFDSAPHDPGRLALHLQAPARHALEGCQEAGGRPRRRGDAFRRSIARAPKTERAGLINARHYYS